MDEFEGLCALNKKKTKTKRKINKPFEDESVLDEEEVTEKVEEGVEVEVEEEVEEEETVPKKKARRYQIKDDDSEIIESSQPEDEGDEGQFISFGQFDDDEQEEEQVEVEVEEEQLSSSQKQLEALQI